MNKKFVYQVGNNKTETLYMFWTVSPSIIKSLRLYIQHQVYAIQVLWLLASKQTQNLYGMMLFVQS